MRYIIHPTLELNFDIRDRRYQAYFENEYLKVSGFKPAKDRTVINVHIVKQLPAAARGDRLRDLRFKKIFRYRYLVRGLESDSVDIYFQQVATGRVYPKIVTLFLQAQIIEPIVYLKFLQRGILFMHSAGVADEKNGYIFPAYGGTGKTTLALGLMGEGMKLLGDDLLIVDPTKQLVHPYLRPLHVFTYNVKTLRNAHVPLNVRAKVKGKDILRSVLETTTRQEFLISTRVHADTLYENFQHSGPVTYRKIKFLKKTGEHESHKITKKNLRELARKILESEDLNDSLYTNILKPSEKAKTVELELDVISSVLAKVDRLDFINTRLLDFRNLAEFKKDLMS